MKKDKGWLKEQINYLKEAVGKPAINDFSRGLNDAYDTLESLIDQLDEPELPVIPQFVAEFIQEIKNRKPLPIILYGALLEAKDIQELFDWIWKNGENHNAFAIAFITGKYEIKKELQWVVVSNETPTCKLYEFILNSEDSIARSAMIGEPIIFKDKAKAEAVALLVGGEVVEVTDNV